MKQLSIRLSSKQFTLLTQMPDSFGLDDALKYHQGTFGSLGRRGFVKKTGKSFRPTREATRTLNQFGAAEIFRRVVTDKLSVHFREHLVSIAKKRTSAA